MALGFTKDVSDFNILHAEVGKTLPFVGSLVVGFYYGLNSKLMVSSNGSTHQAGVLGAWTSPDLALYLPGLNKINFIADIQTGKSAFGAAGIGIGLYFTPSIDILTGPVFFFDSKATTQLPGPGVALSNRPDWLWTIQLDVDFDLWPVKAAAPAIPVAEAPKT